MLFKALEKGDSLSPFLFLFVDEGMSALIRKAEIFQGVAVGRENVTVTNLQFADDTILMGKAFESNSKTI